MEMNVLKIMIDTVKGVHTENYSKAEESEAIRKALIEATGGTTKMNPKIFRRGTQLFSLVEELLPVIIEEGLKEDNPIFNLVEYKNIADGDEQQFVVQANSLFVVADAAAGIRGVRRQRMDSNQTVTISTTMKIVRVYEELSRLLSGRIDFNTFVDNVAKAFNQAVLNAAYDAINGIAEDTVGLNSTYVVAANAAASEEALNTLVEHVEAATGKKAVIYGTKSALRKVTTAQVADEARSDLYNIGYYGKFNGTDMVALRQAHKPGTDTFVLNDKKLFVIASDDKPIKVVDEGEGLLIEREATENNDLTREYVYGQAAGVGAICADKLGVVTFRD